jgi:SET domain-containing protein
MYMNQKLIIKESPIHGLGVFCLEPIQRNEHLTNYYGEEMIWKAFREKYGEYKYNSLYTYPMRRVWKILVAKEEPYRSHNIINFINEGQIPNVILKQRGLYALRDIPADEELLLQYPKDYNRTWKVTGDR